MKKLKKIKHNSAASFGNLNHIPSLNGFPHLKDLWLQNANLTGTLPPLPPSLTKLY